MPIEFQLDVELQDESVDDLLPAAAAGNVELVSRLLWGLHANVNITDANLNTPLLLATQNGHTRVVELLLSFGAYVNQDNLQGITPLLLAAQYGHTRIVEMLLNAGADCELDEGQGVTPFLISAQNGHVPILELLHRFGADANHRDAKGNTPLFVAIINAREEVVQQLIAFHVDLNIQSRVTPLICAAGKGYENIVRMLLEAGADPNLTTETISPFFMALNNRYLNIGRLLLQHGAVISEEDKSIILYDVAGLGYVDVVEFLLGLGVDVNACDENGDAAIFAAVEKGHTAVVAKLIEAGAWVDLEKDGETLQDLAHRLGNVEIIALIDGALQEEAAEDDGWVPSPRG